MTLTPAGRALAAVAATAATALLLTACGSGDEGKGDGDTGSSSAGDWRPGPLDEYMAKALGYSLTDDQPSRTDQQAEIDAQQREVERLVAACMSDQGFDYKPQTNTGTFTSSEDLDVDWGSLEFAETYGYGVTTDPWSSVEIDDSGASDPNQAYVDAMSDSERAAYEAALWGAPVEVDDDADGDGYDWDWEASGCQGAAQHEVFDGSGGADDPQFEALLDEINALWEATQSSPEMTALDADWASCMADAGHADQTTRNQAAEPIYDRSNELQGGGEAVADWDWEANPDGPPAPEVDKAAMDQLRKDEIALAVADWRCADKVSYDDRATEINHAHQQKFVDQHKAELEAWVAAATEARA